MDTKSKLARVRGGLLWDSRSKLARVRGGGLLWTLKVN